MSAADMPSPYSRRPYPMAKLPDYAHPPLVQVRLGVRYPMVASEGDAEARFQQELGLDWQVTPVERRRAGRLPAVWTTRLEDQRVMLSEASPERRLDYHWNGQAGDLYPHYPLVREAFVGVWNAWCRATSSTPAVTRWVVEYVNRIPQGTVWQSLADCSFLRWMSPLPAIEGLPPPNEVHAGWQFPLEQFRAQLFVDLHSDITDGESLKLRLLTQGDIPDPDDTFLAGFDYGREVIVRTFRQLMQPAANEFWGLKA